MLRTPEALAETRKQRELSRRASGLRALPDPPTFEVPQFVKHLVARERVPGSRHPPVPAVGNFRSLGLSLAAGRRPPGSHEEPRVDLGPSLRSQFCQAVGRGRHREGGIYNRRRVSD